MDDEGISLETVANGRANRGALGYTNQRTWNLHRPAFDREGLHDDPGIAIAVRVPFARASGWRD